MGKHVNWKALYSDTETNEDALIRLFNDHIFKRQYPHRFQSGYLAALAREFGVTPMAINKKLNQLRKQERVGYFGERGDATLVTLDKKMPPESSPKDFLKFVIEGNKLLNARDVRQEVVHPVIDYKGWIGLIIGGDWHFEHYRTDTEGLVEDLKLIGSTRNLFYGFNGDLGDFIDLRFMELENETIDIPLRRRYEVIKYLVSLVPNMLFMVAGCHDNWVRTRGRYDIIEAIQSEIMGYYLGFGGTVQLRLGDVDYRIAAHHKFGHESMYNHFHPNYKYLQKTDSSVDIVAIAHRHDIVGISNVYWQGIPKMFVRSGSRQYKTNYAWKEGFRGAIARYPMLLLNGTRKQMISVVNFRTGLPILEALNDGRIKSEGLFE